jgi:hypothetical protein
VCYIVDCCIRECCVRESVWWGTVFSLENMGIKDMGIYLTMSSADGSGLEWTGSARGVVVIVAVVWWGHGRGGYVLCCIVEC